MKIIVMGSGLSGLTAAALLAKKSYEVIVFEQDEKIGGVTATLEQGGYRWDWGQMIVPAETGPHWFDSTSRAAVGSRSRFSTSTDASLNRLPHLASENRSIHLMSGLKHRLTPSAPPAPPARWPGSRR